MLRCSQLHVIDATAIVNALGGAVVALLGAFVARLGMKDRANRGFATFAIAFGIAVTIDNLLGRGDAGYAYVLLVIAVLFVLAAGGLVLMASGFPVALGSADRRRVMAAAAAGLFHFVMILYLIFSDFRGSVFYVDGYAADLVATLGFHLLLAAFVASLTLLALRHLASAPGATRDRRAIRTMSLALVLFPVYWLGSFVFEIVQYGGHQGVYILSSFPPVLLLASLWLLGTRVGMLDRAAARNLAWITLGLYLVGMVVGYWTRAEPGNWGFGVLRMLMVLICFYAITRHQLLGIDLKVRWGISKSILAGLFVAVFFLVTEFTRVFFEDAGVRFGLLDARAVGILAAAGLLFAISPLHRVADRIALRAVPETVPAAGVSPERREASYRRVVARFLADGRVTREEERALAELAGDLGIDAGRAFAIREEVERDRGPARPRRSGRTSK